MGGAAIPYLRFVEVNLQILGIKNYNEDVLLLVMPTMTYSKTVPVVVGTKIIDKALSLMTVGELAKATMTWRQAHFGAVMLGSLQLSCSSSGKCEVTAGATSSFQQGDTMEVWKFWLNDVKGLVHTTQKVTIPPFSTVNIQANTNVKGHCMWVHVLMQKLAYVPEMPVAQPYRDMINTSALTRLFTIKDDGKDPSLIWTILTHSGTYIGLVWIFCVYRCLLL